MAIGLTAEGFTPKTFNEIQNGIKSKLDVLSPGFDFSIESPDGQLIEIMSYELSQAWNELNLVYRSYDPQQATGAALRNLGLITGIVYGAATRSQAVVTLIGFANTLVPAGSTVSDADGNDFATSFDVVLPGTVEIVSVLAGVIPVPAGAVWTISSPVVGWFGATQALDGQEGDVAQTEQAFRNIRNRTVLRNYTSSVDTTTARLYELGLEQVAVVQNSLPIIDPETSQPANSIAATISPLGVISDEEIARVILDTKPAGISTVGTTAVVLDDTQGNTHTVNFTKATAVDIYMNVEVTYLTEDYAGAEEGIIADLIAYILNHQVGEDVIHSRLYSIITPWGKAQVDLLEIGKVNGTETVANVVIADNEFAFCAAANIDFTGTPGV